MAQLQCPVCSSPVPAGATVCPICGTPLNDSATFTPPPALGALPPATHLDNNSFSVGRVLGRGRFGITYLGADLHLKRAVAIKEFFPSGSVRSGTRVLPPAELELQEFRMARQKFLQEAQTLARFHRPSIVNVYEVFEENDTA